MESELSKLQRQVEDLEAALAAVSQTKKLRMLRRTMAFATVLCAAIVTLGFAISFASPSSDFQGEKMGPLNVTAPFIVADNRASDYLL
jgi:ABC-type Fe3+ transport system permease subunit